MGNDAVVEESAAEPSSSSTDVDPVGPAAPEDPTAPATRATSDTSEDPTAPDDARSRWIERLPFLTLLAYLAIGLPLSLFRLGRHRWFLSDEWGMIADHDLSVASLFEPNNAHWSTLPTISYRILWSVFGLRSYLPYQAVLLALHGLVVVLLWFVIRRCGVHAWLATAASAVLVLFGPGGDDIIWAFQIGFVGAIAFGLVHLLLVVDDDVTPKRDALGLLAGLGALMCSGVAVVMVAAVAGAALLRRGWRPALLHGGTMGACYLLYVAIEHPQSESPAGRPGAGDLASWLWHQFDSIYRGIGAYPVVALALVVVTVVGVGLVLASRSWTEIRDRLAIPVALAGAAVAFGLTTALGRWHFGPETAGSSRYVYVGAALVLPLIAVAADAIRRRNDTVLLPLLVLLLLVPLKSNAGRMQDSVYNQDYFDLHRRVFYAIPFVPFARDVPRDVRPLPNVFIPDSVNVGFILDIADDGKMRTDVELTPKLEEEMRVRLGVAQRAVGFARPVPTGCRILRGPIEIEPERGTSFALNSPLAIRTVDGRRVQAPKVDFNPRLGNQLTVELDDLRLIVSPGFAREQFEWCDPL